MAARVLLVARDVSEKGSEQRRVGMCSDHEHMVMIVTPHIAIGSRMRLPVKPTESKMGVAERMMGVKEHIISVFIDNF